MSASKKEKLEILEAAESRAFAELIDADPKEVTFYNILANIGQLRQVTEIVRFGDPDLFVSPEDEQKPVLTLVQPQEHKETEEEAPKTPEPDVEIPPQPKPVVETKAAPERPALTIEEVRKKLVPIYQTRPVDVSGALQSLGVTRLTELSPDKYEELLQKVGVE